MYKIWGCANSTSLFRIYSGDGIMKKKLKYLIFILVIIGGILAGGNYILSKPVDSSDHQEIAISVKEGSSTGEIANILYENQLIRNKFFFKIKSKILGYDGKYFSGNFKAKKSMSMGDIMSMLTSAQPGKSVVIVEGMSLEKIAKTLEKAGITKADDFFYEVENGNFNYDFLKDAPKGKTRLEGYLYPDTYQFEEGQSAHSVIETMLKTFEKKLDKDYYRLSKEKGLSFHEVLTIASIIQNEAQKDDERNLVASVIYNRLKIDMPLQMDSTLVYVTGAERIKSTNDDINTESPYNTYLNKGLPPGPICASSKASIDAALNPAETNYLYFVVTEKLDGRHVFSETYEEFLVNKEKFDKAYYEYIRQNPDKE